MGEAFDGLPRERRPVPERLALGAALIVLGSLLMLDKMGLIAVGGMNQLWPLFLVALGIGKLAKSGARGGGVMLLGVGLIFLAQSCGIAPMDRTWPLFLVLGGIVMLLRGVLGDDRCESRRARRDFERQP